MNIAEGTTKAAVRQLKRRLPQTYAMAEELGCTFKQTKSNHFALLLPNGMGQVVVPVSSGDKHADKLCRSQLRRTLRMVEAAAS